MLPSEVVQSLTVAGLVVPAASSAESHATKRRLLLQRAESAGDGRVEFLSRYDALMRLVEGSLVEHGWEFGDSPHLAMKRVVAAVGGVATMDELDRLSSARHRVKKEGGQPTAQMMLLLRRIDAALSS